MKQISPSGAYVEISRNETLFSCQGGEAQLQNIHVLMFISESENPAQFCHPF